MRPPRASPAATRVSKTHDLPPVPRLRVSAAISGVAVVIAVTLLPARYEVNDDFGQLLSLAGYDGFPASADGTFLSRLLAEGLYAVYRMFPGAPWLGLLLVGSAWFGLTLFVHALRGFAKSRWEFAIVAVAWLALLGHCVYSITFTSVALMLELGGALHLLAYSRGPLKRRGAPFLAAAAVGMALLWRWRLALFALVFLAPALPWLRRADFLKLAACALGLALLVAIDRGWDAAATNSPAHQEYREYARLRSQFHDSPLGNPGPNTPEALDAAGWTESDYELFRTRWMLYDDSVFHARTLHAFLNANRTEKPAGWRDRLVTTWSFVWGANALVLPIFCAAMAALWLFRLTSEHDTWRPDGWRIAAAIGMMLVPTLALVGYRFVGRVSFPLLAYWLGAMGLLLAPREPSDTTLRLPPRRVGGTLRAASMGAVVGLLGIEILCAARMARIDLSSLRSERARTEFIRESLNTAFQDARQPPVVLRLDPRVGLNAIGLHPLREARGWPRMRLVPVGWAVRSPRYQDALQSLGSRSGREFLEQMLDERNDFHLVLSERQSDDPARTRWLWESYMTRRIGPATYRLDQERVFERGGQRLLFYRFRAVREN